jgi:hypothetical protein
MAARYRGMPTLRSALLCATHFWQVSSQFETAVTRLQPANSQKRSLLVRRRPPFGDIALNLLKDLVK